MINTAVRTFRSLAALGLITALLLGITPRPGAAAGGDGIRPITLPIHPDRVDDVTWSDTWGAARSGGRRHIGVDMLGPKMVPLVAARSGTVTWGRFDNDRGSLIRFRDDDGWEYQYIHLNNDSPGTDDGEAACAQVFSERICAAVRDGMVARGTRVTEGEIIGYLGDSGNAENTGAHLHFEIYRPGPSGPEPVNPTPSVDAARERVVSGASGPAAAPPPAAPGEDGFVDHLWYELYGRYPTSGERRAFSAAVAADGVWTAAAARVGPETTAAAIDRLYLAFFLRYPDTDGIRYWIRVRGAGHSSEDIAEWFAESDEFRIRYGGVGFDGFLDQLYQDVFGRAPDPEGKRYWLERLEDGDVSRGSIVVYFADGAEMLSLTDTRNEIVAVNLLSGGAVPSAEQVASWNDLRASVPRAGALARWYEHLDATS